MMNVAPFKCINILDILLETFFFLDRWGQCNDICTTEQYIWYIPQISALLCATTQQSYWHGAGIRRSWSVVRSSNQFSPKPSNELTPTKLGERHQSAICPGHFVFQNFDYFFWMFFFTNLGPYGRKKYSKRHLWKYRTESLPKIQAWSYGGSLDVVKRTMTFQIVDFFCIFSVFVVMGPYQSENFKRYLLWSYTSDSPPKVHVYS